MTSVFGAAFVAAAIVSSWSADLPVVGDWAPPDTVITMVRGGCEKRCPVYRVAIFAEGTVIVEGRFYLRRPVLARSELHSQDVKKLVDRFMAIDYFHLRDACGINGQGCSSVIPGDARNVTTTLVSGGRGKSIIHRDSCVGEVAKQLTDLEHAIDETAHTERWLKDALRR
ncbi:MAG TPA: DUF6438 domain-containing protein [Polyangia bacterium]|nr:DUF6438 domain-containing protein [Polyangia bacterium]